MTSFASPRDAKLALARSIVARYHGEAAAAAAVEEYERKARGGEPDSMPELELAAGATLVDILVASGLAASRTRATNDLKNNAVAVDGVRTKDNLVLAVGAHVVRSGKESFCPRHDHVMSVTTRSPPRRSPPMVQRWTCARSS